MLIRSKPRNTTLPLNHPSRLVLSATNQSMSVHDRRLLPLLLTGRIFKLLFKNVFDDFVICITPSDRSAERLEQFFDPLTFSVVTAEKNERVARSPAASSLMMSTSIPIGRATPSLMSGK